MAITVVLASGGINSTVAAMRAKQTDDVHLFFVDYSQRAAQAQRDALRSIAKSLHWSVTAVKMPHVSELAAIPRQHESSKGAAPLLETPSRVPGLMSVMLGSAVQLAQRLGAERICVGTSEAADELENEHAPGQGRPDHRRDFFYVFNVMLENLQKSKTPIRLETPLIDLTRDEIVKLGDRYHTPFDLTYSCDGGTKPPCCSCAGCRARSKAFASANLLDPANVISGTHA